MTFLNLLRSELAPSIAIGLLDVAWLETDNTWTRYWYGIVGMKTVARIWREDVDSSIDKERTKMIIIPISFHVGLIEESNTFQWYFTSEAMDAFGFSGSVVTKTSSADVEKATF